MIGTDTDRNICLLSSRLLVADSARKGADKITQGLQGIHIKNRTHFLHRYSKTLQTHSGINILLRQIRVVVVSVVVKLGEHNIPDLHETVSLAAHDILRPIAEFRSAVIVNLAARPAGSGSVLPEVILFAELINPLRRNMHVVQPDLIGLVVIHIDRRIETIRIQSDHFRQKLPCPGNRLLFEIITKGEITQHLKIGAVTGCFADILQITGADALLAGGYPSSGGYFLSGKPRLHRSHTGIDNKKRIVVMRNQRKTVQTQTSLCLKKMKKHLPELVHSVLFPWCHNIFPFYPPENRLKF